MLGLFEKQEIINVIDKIHILAIYVNKLNINYNTSIDVFKSNIINNNHINTEKLINLNIYDYTVIHRKDNIFKLIIYIDYIGLHIELTLIYENKKYKNNQRD